MGTKHGNLSISSENIFPVIKKWLYSDHDIFYRELISNGCDAITKLKKLDIMGEYTLPDGYKPKITVTLRPKAKTIEISDNGIGMTEDEVDEYINQIAFSGATDFLEKYKDKANEDQIIGHFGLGFYSAFMVADSVHIDTLSFKEGAKAVHWECDGGTEFDLSEGSRTEVGTTITLYLNEDCLEFANEYRAKEVLEKYCSFMPIEIYMETPESEPKTQIIDKDEKLDTDIVIEEIHKDAVTEEQEQEDGTKKMVETSPAKDQLKIEKRPEPINDPAPLWTKTPSDCTKEEYLEFYRKVFMDYKEPLFWIHLNMDYPFNLKGILYFPRINTQYDTIEGTIKLYNNQVFVADNIKEVIPEFLLLLKGVIDCPDLPLNVSRSALQNDGFVTKISDYIVKKVADKLSGMCKTEREDYEKNWEFIGPFVKYGCLRDNKFSEKINEYILFKDLNDKFITLPELLAPQDEKTDETADGEASDTAESKSENESGEDEEYKDDRKTVYYVSDLVQQGQYISMFKEQGENAVILDHQIDTPFITHLEQQNEHYKFERIDADVTSALTEDDDADLTASQDTLLELFKKALGKEDMKVKVEKLKNKDMAAVLTTSEQGRRMQEMMKMYAANGMGGMDFPVDETLILNASHPLVEYLLNNKESDNASLFAKQLYDLARIANHPITPDEMTAFLTRSNEIMMLLTK